jgi:hypothetical protein
LVAVFVLQTLHVMWLAGRGGGCIDGHFHLLAPSKGR